MYVVVAVIVAGCPVGRGGHFFRLNSQHNGHIASRHIIISQHGKRAEGALAELRIQDKTVDFDKPSSI